MNNKQLSSKLFKAALATSLAAGAMVVAAPFNADAAVTNFKDLSPASDHYEPVMALVNRGVIQGYEDGTFKPNASVTRGQAAKIIALALKLDTKNVKNPGFKDVSTNHAYYGEIAALVQAGIITGFPEDNTYRPGDTLTRAQMSKIISLAFKLPEATDIKNNFTDVKSTSWYKGYVQTLVNYQVTIGTTPTTFEPGSHVRRGQLASFVIRAEKAVVTPPPAGGGGYTPPAPDGTPDLNNLIADQLTKVEENTSVEVKFDKETRTFTVDVEEAAESTLKDFVEAAGAESLYNTLKDRGMINSATIGYAGASYSFDIKGKPDFDVLVERTINQLNNALEFAKKETRLDYEETTLEILKGKEITFTITGSIDGKTLNSVKYTIKF